jgi:hypothetical protein
MLRRMSVVEQKTPAGGKSKPMLGCRWETPTVRSQRSRRIKRLQKRLAAAFSADGHGEHDPIGKARFGASAQGFALIGSGYRFLDATGGGCAGIGP